MNSHFTKEEIQMIHKHISRYSTSVVIREIQMETVIRYYYTPIRMADTRKITDLTMY